LKNWIDESTNVPWIKIERSIVYPLKFGDVLFSAMSPYDFIQTFGPIIGQAVKVWKHVEKLCNWSVDWHSNIPIFHNLLLRIGKKAIQNAVN